MAAKYKGEVVPSGVSLEFMAEEGYDTLGATVEERRPGGDAVGVETIRFIE